MTSPEIGQPSFLLVSAAVVVPPRGVQQQRTAGRAAAAAALERAGCPDITVRRRSDGAPVFPGGLVGSITHTRHVAVAAVARGLCGIGVDLETADMRPDAADVLLDHVEQDRLWPSGDLQTLRWLMVAKEAGFKALSDQRGAHGGMYWRVRLHVEHGRLWAIAGSQRAVIVGTNTAHWAFALALRS
jgi:4'-phosphopantetheinyl transferase EntD